MILSVKCRFCGEIFRGTDNIVISNYYNHLAELHSNDNEGLNSKKSKEITKQRKHMRTRRRRTRLVSIQN
jgi:hypothetical protein